MDPIVARAMARWPNVPAVYGWLALDRRGNWLIKAERITHQAMLAARARSSRAPAIADSMTGRQRPENRSL